MPDVVRVYCDDPDYADTWIDIEARWTLGEQRRMLEVVDDEFWTFLRGKCAACHIQTGDGGVITDPAQLSGEGLADCDVLIIGWLGSVLPAAIAKRRALGNASARLSLPSSGQQRMTAAPMMTTPNP